MGDDIKQETKNYEAFTLEGKIVVKQWRRTGDEPLLGFMAEIF